ncbi:DODA-type extradiol aromatic ring-opening family dioxygenase [Paenibacillus cremeus]|uniref:Dioxygenase n=1 Tax=Paenibacillus cremeus TaxID=2163881 RepID=A0A559KF81_9BACL|nr:class III extradiol ring-cleavage dioxygenase [Paenibacillus cremeus]TVY10777.1 dioxygenase [Paenibacillus cremeus]
MASSFFIAHGSPMLAIQHNTYTEDMRKLGERLGKPEAVVVFSAHWVSATQSVTYTDGTLETIYDFRGFPQELFEVVYPAQGSVAIAKDILSAFQAHGNGIDVQVSQTRGLDHGAWVILRHMFPNADVPVINLSVNPMLPPEKQYEIGKAIASLKDRNIVIIGSGSTVHNFRRMNFHAENQADPWAKEFDDWLIARMGEWDTAALFDYKRLAPYAAEATPDYEHFAPLYLAMGTGHHAKKAAVQHQSYMYGSLSHLIIEFA